MTKFEQPGSAAPGHGPVVWNNARNRYERRDAPIQDERGRLRSTWLVDISGYDTARAAAFTRAQALYIVFVAFSGVYGGSFRDFLARGIHVRSEPCP